MMLLHWIAALLCLLMPFSVIGGTPIPKVAKTAEGMYVVRLPSGPVEVRGWRVGYAGFYQPTDAGERSYVFLKGTGCTQCDAPLALGIQPLVPANNSYDFTKTAYPYPGKLFSQGTLTRDLRAFYGRCLDAEAGMVWQGYEWSENGQIRPLAEAVTFTDEGPKERILSSPPALTDILTKIRDGKCWELPAEETHES